MYTFNEIDFTLRAYDALQAQSHQAVDQETAIQRMFIWYRLVRPILLGIAAAVQIFKPTWRAVISGFVAAADVAANITPPPAAPAAATAEALASDSTPTDPVSTDPSFKAGKDL